MNFLFPRAEDRRMNGERRARSRSPTTTTSRPDPSPIESQTDPIRDRRPEAAWPGPSDRALRSASGRCRSVCDTRLEARLACDNSRPGSEVLRRPFDEQAPWSPRRTFWDRRSSTRAPGSPSAAAPLAAGSPTDPSSARGIDTLGRASSVMAPLKRCEN